MKNSFSHPRHHHHHTGGPSFRAIGIIIAIGIVYGDLGTSPLYVMKAVMNALPHNHPDYIIGAVSCVIWTLTLQTSIKYILITLRADNKGEGGIFSLFALIRRKYRWAYAIAAIGAATLLADGVITPSITVISAIEGLNIVYPSIPIVPIAIGIIVLLFAMQPFGTNSLGRFFGLIMVVWFFMLGTVGFSNLIEYLPILKAFNPVYAILFLKSTPQVLIILGAIFLCTTGAEALYSDLGHCGLRNIQVSWIFVKIALILNYLGQGAWVIAHPNSIVPDVNPFFEIIPSWFALPGVIMATLAAIIASQALISGSFTIITEAISLGLWPNIKIKYPTESKGQMFIPGINYVLMLLCVMIIHLFRTSSNMEAAYGLSITITMLMTTILLFLYMRVREVKLWYSIPVAMCFLVIESGFLLANSMKFAHGGFITIVIAGFLFLIMYVWYNGRRIKNRCVTYEKIAPVIPIIDRLSCDTQAPKYATHLVYVTRAKYKTDIESKIIYSLINRPKRADTYWFVYLWYSDEPYEFNYNVTTFVKEKIFRVDITSGFKLGFHVDDYLRKITHKMEKDGEVDLLSRYPSLRDNGIRGDFRYVVVERIMRNSFILPFFKKIVLTLYTIIQKFATSDTQILDLDPSNVTVESAPLVRKES
ncbi:MAG: KUP/HAK/KT family potassium transporter [Candidatus Azobacteroides sp.]|nr:KUP/HAK/KT family potassium transporter [Candidatus Azobacteroides sp.]